MSYTLTNENIDAVSEKIVSYLEDIKADPKDIARIRLGAEDCLIRLQEHFGEDYSFTLKCGKSLGKTRIAISVKGPMFDPFNTVGESDETTSRFMRTTLAQMGNLPIWRYNLGTNVISFLITHKTVPEWLSLIIAIVAAIAIGLLVNIAPAEFRETFEGSFLAPILNTFMGFLSAMAGPMIFLEIVWGIYSIGDAATFSVLGKKLVGRFLAFITLFTVVIGMAMVPFFALNQAENGAMVDFSPLLQMILDIVPANLFAPFLDGNTLQILFVAVIVGLAMLFVAEKTTTVALVIEQIDILVQIIMEVISKLVPVFVFGSLLDMIVSDQLSQIASSYKLAVANIVAIVVVLLVSVALTCARTHTNMGVFLKKMMPTFVIGLTTASSSAAFATNRRTCSNSYGISAHFADFGVPFSQVIFKPTVALLYFTSAICVAEMFGVETSGQWFISVIIMSIILSVATAPLPGSALASLTMLFAQLGIPSEGIAVVLALNIVLDFLETPTDLVSGQCQLVIAANNYGMLNKDILHDPKA